MCCTDTPLVDCLGMDSPRESMGSSCTCALELQFKHVLKIERRVLARWHAELPSSVQSSFRSFNMNSSASSASCCPVFKLWLLTGLLLKPYCICSSTLAVSLPVLFLWLSPMMFVERWSAQRHCRTEFNQQEFPKLRRPCRWVTSTCCDVLAFDLRVFVASIFFACDFSFAIHFVPLLRSFLPLSPSPFKMHALSFHSSRSSTGNWFHCYAAAFISSFLLVYPLCNLDFTVARYIWKPFAFL
jgi:hypothetical protein